MKRPCQAAFHATKSDGGSHRWRKKSNPKKKEEEEEDILNNPTTLSVRRKVRRGSCQPYPPKEEEKLLWLSHPIFRKIDDKWNESVTCVMLFRYFLDLSGTGACFSVGCGFSRSCSRNVKVFSFTIQHQPIPFGFSRARGHLVSMRNNTPFNIEAKTNFGSTMLQRVIRTRCPPLSAQNSLPFLI